MRKRKSYWRRWGVRKSNPGRQHFGLKDLEGALRELSGSLMEVGIRAGAFQRSLTKLCLIEEEKYLRGLFS